MKMKLLEVVAVSTLLSYIGAIWVFDGADPVASVSVLSAVGVVWLWRAWW